MTHTKLKIEIFREREGGGKGSCISLASALVRIIKLYVLTM
jgi:hypothetical protein